MNQYTGKAFWALNDYIIDVVRKLVVYKGEVVRVIKETDSGLYFTIKLKVTDKNHYIHHVDKKIFDKSFQCLTQDQLNIKDILE